jgi:hypothetical protein
MFNPCLPVGRAGRGVIRDSWTFSEIPKNDLDKQLDSEKNVNDKITCLVSFLVAYLKRR